MSVSASPGVWAAFAAGLLSFFAPCSLPLYPSYISYISGVSFAGGDGPAPADARMRALTHSLFFIGGFSAIFIMLGYGASLLGQMLLEYRGTIRVVGGVFVSAMGLYLMGWLKIGPLSRMLSGERRIRVRARRASYLGAVLVGVGFAAGWTPCIGPILASVLAFAATQPGLGAPLMAAYSAGFAVPFLVLALTLGSIRFFVRYSERVSRIGGAAMVVMGILLATGYIASISSLLVRFLGPGV